MGPRSSKVAYMYIQSEPHLWTVGFESNGGWEPESDHESPDAAERRVELLNAPTLARELDELRGKNEQLRTALAGFVRCAEQRTWPMDGRVTEAKNLLGQPKMASSNKECEYDPDHLYHDHREAKAFGAEVELLTRNRDAARMIIGPLSERPDLVDACEDVVREADELRAERERWREVVEIFSAGNVALEVENEQLRATANRYFDVLERQQAEVFGAEAREMIDAMEQSTTGTRELADARDAVFVLLGRPKDG